MFDPPFSGPNRPNRVNLSTASTSTSSSLLETVRAERQLREQRGRQDAAARKIQAAWRADREGQKVRTQLLGRLDEMVDPPSGSWSSREVERRARSILILGRWKGKDVERRVDRILMALVINGREIDPSTGSMRLLSPLQLDPGYIVVIAIIARRLLQMCLQNGPSDLPQILDLLDVTLSRQSYSFLHEQADDMLCQLLDSLVRSGWSNQLMTLLRQLISTNQPKKKNPLIQPVIRLITSPFLLMTSTSEASIPSIINQLLAIPALPSSLPLASVTHISQNLPVFTVIVPYAANHPYLLSEGDLISEEGKTYLLANLATFGITGGMLSRYPESLIPWMKVVGTILSQVSETWGKWAEGVLEQKEESMMMNVDPDSDDEDQHGPHSLPITSIPTSRPRQLRPLLPANISSKLLLYPTSIHINLLFSATNNFRKALVDFATFSLNLLHAFRGTSKWEVVLDSLTNGLNGKQLVKQVWREGVRGMWARSGEKSSWETFGKNSRAAPLLLLTHLYNHYLLVTPDDEFFDPARNPLSMDEIIQLSAIWRDLAYWGYMSGIDNGSKKMGTEDDRNLFTRGVTRIAERNARRQFAPEDHWVMTSLEDQQAFIEAAVLEEANILGDEQELDENNLDKAVIARQRLTKRQLAHLSPRLGLLNNLPMAVPFATRLKIFRHFVETDRIKMRLDQRSMNRRSRFFNEVTIRRNNLAEDGFDRLSDLGTFLKGRVHITFIDKFGEEERGIDGGGLFKEFLTGIYKEVFDTERGLWLANDQNQLYPNPHSYATEDHQLSWYKFIGMIIGKALYEGILVDVSFAGFFLAKWLSRQSYLDDLNSLDKELYKGLNILKNYPKPEDLALTFTLDEEEFGVRKSVQLVPGGSDIAVTAENRLEYIQLVCKYRLDRQIAKQSRAFFSGLSKLIDPKWLRMFDQTELQQLIGGEESPIDIDDLKAHTDTSGFPDSRTVNLFWAVMRKFSQEEKKALLRFVTSCGRPPLLGFAHLNPGFALRFASADTGRLPSASSCFNLLKLPGYTDEKTMREKLLQAINSGAGFDLS